MHMPLSHMEAVKLPDCLFICHYPIHRMKSIGLYFSPACVYCEIGSHSSATTHPALCMLVPLMLCRCSALFHLMPVFGNSMYVCVHVFVCTSWWTFVHLLFHLKYDIFLNWPCSIQLLDGIHGIKAVFIGVSFKETATCKEPPEELNKGTEGQNNAGETVSGTPHQRKDHTLLLFCFK